VSRLKRILAPLLQVWRLLLCDKVAGKSENISVFSLSKRLGIDEGAAAGLCKLLSLHLNDEPMSSMQPTVVLKSSLSEPLHLSVATQNPEIFLRKLMTVCLTILPAELHLTSEQKREMDGLTATADCKS
jgi:hypothetical protein